MRSLNSGVHLRGSRDSHGVHGMRSAGELRSDTYNLLLSMMSIETIVKDM